MGFFSKLKKVFNPGGAIVSKVIGDGHDYQGVLDYAMNGKKNAEKDQAAAKEQQQSEMNPRRVFTPDPGLNPQAMRLGWTNGGYRYHNSPFTNGSQMPAPAPQQMQTPQAPQAAPMSFGGGAPPMGAVGRGASGLMSQAVNMVRGNNSGGNFGMGASGPQQVLQGPQNPGSMPAAGAQPPGPPTMQTPMDPQMIQAQALRGRIGGFR